PSMALAALSFARNTLVTTSDSGALCGVDGQAGPVSVWWEGVGQAASAGMPDAQALLNILVSQQRPDGSVPGSPDTWNTVFGWLTTWSGVAPTAWLYFAANQTS